jgi:hypothetical protein
VAVNLIAVFFQIVVDIVILSPLLWLAARAIVGKGKARFSHAVLITLIGSLVGDFIGALINGALASIIVLIIWLWLIKHFFECGWLKALAIAIVAVIIFLIIAFFLLLLGLSIFAVA